MATVAKLGMVQEIQAGAAAGAPDCAARHYSPAEVGKLWNLSPDTVRRLFENEPGVLLIGNTAPRRGKRRYTTLRIPEHVLDRVHRRLSRV